ncbi:hypothetical protein AU196_10185 [Mycobacterium sp. IS-1742]|uniref:hypothetical protein n=1 Tax=Mycobacterium sp. IS-1742 TaxID=1772285 RepID=UPI00074009F7|nr:hypothetical protein [Mycobacterium sp. IS-1742]KUI24106.1 hypothetical protein AU196_10185 [Mycobacterium sp. IS-1742]
MSAADSTGHPDDPAPQHDPKTGIIRRHPTGEIPVASPAPPSESPTGIIRRHPTGGLPTVSAEPQTSYIEPPAVEDGTQTSYIPRPRPVEIPPTALTADPRTAVAAAVLAILSGWATAVIATDLITGWWSTDRLFCVAIGFLTTISAAASIGGLVLLLLRRRMSRLLIVVGCVIGLLIFGSLFVAGAKFPWIVYAIPVLPLAAIVLTLLPSTGRWAQPG